MYKQVPIKFNIVIPCYNEQEKIKLVVNSFLPLKNLQTIIVVDDSSTDGSATIVKGLSNKNIILLKNKKNRGAGYSIIKGLKHSYFLKNSDYTVIADADGQHSKSDIQKILNPLKNSKRNTLITYAVRNRKLSSTPISKYIVAFCVRFSMFVLFGYQIKDPFCGLRCFSNELLKGIKFSEGFDWSIDCTALISELKHNAVSVQVPARFSDYSLKKGQSMFGGIRLFVKIINTRIIKSSGQQTRKKTSIAYPSPALP